MQPKSEIHDCGISYGAFFEIYQSFEEQIDGSPVMVFEEDSSVQINFCPFCGKKLTKGRKIRNFRRETRARVRKKTGGSSPF